MEFVEKPLALAHRANAAALVQTVREEALANAGKIIRRQFSARMAFSTVFGGTRLAPINSGDAADILALQHVLPPGTVNTDILSRDLASNEPPLMRIIRQLEGKPPAVLACITAEDDLAADDAVSEARALGFHVGRGDRQIGLIAPSGTRVLSPDSGLIEMHGGTSWHALQSAAADAQMSIDHLIPDHFASPIEAFAAGAGIESTMDRRFGIPWRGSTALPVGLSGVTERVWVFADARRADDVFRDVVRRFSPAFAETIPAIDGHVLMASKLWRGHRRYRDIAAGGLRIVFSGAPVARRAALAEASWTVERKGGVLHHRQPAPPPQILDAIAVAVGAARFVRPMKPAQVIPLPQNCLIFPKHIAIGRTILTHQVVWYLRDLARSLEQARTVLGAATDTRELSGLPDRFGPKQSKVMDHDG